MSLRIVLYGEGPGDTGGELSQLPPPTEILAEGHLGPAHELIRRCVVHESSIPAEATLFLCPLRVRGRHPKGSDLLDRASLRQLLTWPSPQRRPDVAIVLVDQDEVIERGSTLREFTAGIPLPHVITVAIQEFESWLIADHGAVAQAFSQKPTQPPAIESLRRREAKNLLDRWIAESAQEPRAARLTLARTADLAVLGRLSAFQTFEQELRAILNPR